MSLNIGDALQEGIARSVSRVGIVLAVLWGVLGALNLLAYNSMMAALTAGMPSQPTMIGPSLDVSATIAGVVVFVLYLASFVVMAAALRTFVTDETRTIHRAYLTRNLGWMILNLFVGYLVFFVAIWIGFVALFVPGVFLMVSLYFWFVLVVVEDQNFVEAFRNSWALARGNRWSLLGLGLIVLVPGSILYGVLFVVAFATPPWVGLVVYAAILAVFGVFSVATTARAYVQLAIESGTGEAAAVA